MTIRLKYSPCRLKWAQIILGPFFYIKRICRCIIKKEAEIWKPVNEEFYKELYLVSNYGRIKSLAWNKERILKQKNTNSGYLSVLLCKNNKRKEKLVHRLVMEAFFEKSERDINHIDGNKTNNFIENLEFVTKSQNMTHALKVGLIDISKTSGKNNYNYNHTKYNFKHDSGILENLTCYEMCLKYPELVRQGLYYIRKNKNATYKKWKIV